MSTSAVLYDRPQCTVCGLPVALETAKADEYGKAIHEHCYLLKISLHNGTLPPKEGTGGRMASSHRSVRTT